MALPGDFLRHFEAHFHQRILRQSFGPVEKYAGLTEVLSGSGIPTHQVFHPITYRCFELQPARTRHPRRLYGMALTFSASTFRRSPLQALGTAHGLPVVLVLRRAEQADLVVV